MDPLSITASTITLIQASGIIATSLGVFASSLRTVDARIVALCNELSSLTGFLAAIKKTLDNCKPDMALVKDNLWHQTELYLANCQTTLNELDLLVKNIQGSSRSKGFGWKARAVVDLSIYNDDIVTSRDKLYQSNSALQTILHTMMLSVSLKNNESQDLVLRRLDELRFSIDEALHAVSRPVGGFRHGGSGQAGSHMARNVRRLAEEAKHFHTAVSSTTSTVGSDGSEVAWQPYPGVETSLFGDFPSVRRDRVKQFLDINSFRCPEPRGERSGSAGAPFPGPSTYNPVSNLPSTVDKVREKSERSLKLQRPDEQDEEDVELERTFINGLQELATACIRECKHNDAIVYLREALSQCAPGDEVRQMQMQLALCYFIQGKWKLAEPLVKSLAALKVEENLSLCNLLHALALAYLYQNSLAEAKATCRQALQGKMRLLKSCAAEPREYWITLGLFATISRITGDELRAEVFRRKLPLDFVYYHPENEIDFVQTQMVVQKTEFDSMIPDSSLDASPPTSPNNADDEASPSTETQSPLRRHFSRLFGPRRQHDDSSEETLATPNGSKLTSSPMSATASSPSKMKWLRGKRVFRTKPKAETQKKANNHDGAILDNAGSVQPKVVSCPLDRGPILSNVRQAHKDGSFQNPHLDGFETPGRSKIHRQFSWSSDRYTYYDRAGKRLRTESDRAQDRKLLDARETDARKRFATSHMPPVPELPEAAAILELADTGMVAELADTGLTPRETIMRHSRCSASGGAVSRVEGNSETANSCRTRVDDSSHERSNLDESICRVPLKELSSDGLDVFQPLSIDHRQQFSTANRDTLGNIPGTSRHRPKNDTPDKKDRLKSKRYLRRENISYLKCSPEIAVSAKLSTLLSTMAGIMAPLRYIKDPDELRVKRMELQALLSDLKSMSNDKLIVSDAEQVLRSLGQRIREAREFHDDSGYESMARGRGDRTPITSGARSPLRIAVPTRPFLKQRPCQSRCLDSNSGT